MLYYFLIYYKGKIKMFTKHFTLKLLFILIPGLILFSNLSFGQENESNNNDTISLRTMHNELDTAGEWIKVTKDQVDSDEITDSEDQGYVDPDVNYEYVWRPHYTVLYSDWNPYENGRWVWTYEYGWTWVSYYSWGWLNYHYGRWWYSSVWGWVWSPGRVWAPCWVSWYWDRGYVGWHPISPRRRWHWNNGRVITRTIIPNEKKLHKWTFVKEKDFTKEIKKTKYADVTKDAEFLNNTKYANTKNFEKGPDVKELELKTNEKIPVKKVKFTDDQNKTVTRENNSFTEKKTKKVNTTETKGIKNTNTETKGTKNTNTETKGTKKTNTETKKTKSETKKDPGVKDNSGNNRKSDNSTGRKTESTTKTKSDRSGNTGNTGHNGNNGNSSNKGNTGNNGNKGNTGRTNDSGSHNSNNGSKGNTDRGNKK